jgi:hypothetical protein
MTEEANRMAKEHTCVLTQTTSDGSVPPRCEACQENFMARPLPTDTAVTGAIALLRENWRHNDGAEGESVKLVCNELERLRALLAPEV